MRRPALVLLAALGVCAAHAQNVSDVAATRHNLSASGTGNVSASTETQVCVFCHTPHAATNAPGAPLWNRQLSGQTYTTYTSSSLDAETIAGTLAQPAGSSKLCLSCHDGTLALGAVNVLGGQQNVTIDLTGTAVGGTMPPGQGELTGFTRNLGTDLRNDHPISLTYDTTLAAVDGELFDPAVAAHIGIRAPGVRPPVPLEATGPAGEGQVQCGTCHDPHVIDASVTPTNKFLRLQRFQQSQPADGSFDETLDINCLACHDKDGWSGSAHASTIVADETYLAQPASLREFPAGLPVWQAGCLNCHDTHSVHGSRRLLREGTDAPGTPKSGGESAIEETCYQCHGAAPVVTNAGGAIRNIAGEFSLAIRMPISSTDQRAGIEVHDVTDNDLSESQVLLGKTNLVNRHAECTDCHSPHRVMRNSLFNGLGSATLSAHEHASGHSNIASGALRGTWGVEPVYGGTAFLSQPTSYEVKSGDGGTGASDAVTSNHVTREYQVCLKCHSDYAYDDDGVYPIGSRPGPGDSGGGTAAGTNNLDQYTNQAMEFQAPLGDRGETGGNHRSWHPVIDSTGRSAAVRNMSATTNLFLAPWNGASIGSQTMYCSDCHGRNTANGTVVPPGTSPWGPHGSENDFLLKGTWTATSGANNTGLCFRCHNHTNYATEANEGDRGGFESGFGGADDTNLHAFHAKRLGRNLQCSWCHVAVPHGWKNKALLVNLNDVGPEAGLAPGTEVPIGSSAQTYDVGPYYMNAKLKILNFRTSGTWRVQDCGSASGQGGTARDWMRNVCENPP
ncbi:MAG: hypothetical protein OEY08_00630 [Gammaproteobacteria bacterium]|nr:hypothetical protein [Gammaproteobacteria bacterium]